MLFAIGPTFTVGDLPIRLGNPGSATEEIQIKERNYFICCCYDRIYVCKLVQFYITFRYGYKLKAKLTGMHCKRMRIVRCSGRLSCHARLLPRMPPLPHMPPFAMHTSCHMPPTTMHAPCHACPPPFAMHAPPQWTEGIIHACENINNLYLCRN